MKAAEFRDALDSSNLTTSEVLERIFEGGFVNKEDFPNAYDSKGNFVMKIEDKRSYNTFCPFHSDQKVGDSFNINNEEKRCYCYNGACDFSKRPLNLTDLVMATVLKLDYSIVYEFELSKQHFWKAAEFLVKEFGDELGLKLSDIRKKKTFKRNPTEKILKETMEYYHFLGTKNEAYSNKLETFLKEVRHLDNGVMTIKEIIEEYKLGITPYSKTNDRLYQYLKKKRFTDEEILESRVCITNHKGEIQDFFIGRVIVPYLYKGKTIGLYGRDMNPNGDKKYRHLRLEAEVRIPNGLDGILGEEEFFMPEGEFSKIAIAALGYKNTMETRGVNGFKVEHAELIRKVRKSNPDKCKRCYLVFDPDAAGADSVDKIGKRLIDVGVEVLVIRLPIFYEGKETTYIDPNDLLEIYGKDAKKEFDKLKEEAISYDAFMLLHKLQKNRPDTLSSARIAFKNLAVYLESIPRIERIFILEEVLMHLETKVEKNILREYLKEYWLSEEAKKPIEGLSEATLTNNPFLVLTKNENFYETSKAKLPYLVLIRNNSAFLDKTIEKKLLLDSSFSEEEKENFSTLNVSVGQCEIKPTENGKFSIRMISKK